MGMEVDYRFLWQWLGLCGCCEYLVFTPINILHFPYHAFSIIELFHVVFYSINMTCWHYGHIILHTTLLHP